MKNFAIALLLSALCMAANTPSGVDMLKGVPKHGRPFYLLMNPLDTIGTVYQCEDRIHAHRWRDRHGRIHRDTGLCDIPRGSLRPGIHNALDPKYPGIFVSVK
jgi:hypothetical protein